MTKPDDIAYLPIEGPPEGYRPNAVVWFRCVAGPNSDVSLRVLGPPVPAPPALSPEARAVLEAAESWMHGAASDHEVLCACRAYARSLTPPDPLARVRHLLEKIVAHTADDTDRAHARAALDALAKLGDR